MQQMAGHMNLLNPFVFNQFGAYGAYAQVNYLIRKKYEMKTKMNALKLNLQTLFIRRRRRRKHKILKKSKLKIQDTTSHWLCSSIFIEFDLHGN